MFFFARSNSVWLAMVPAYLVMICGGLFLSLGWFNVSTHHQWWFDKSTLALIFVPVSFHSAIIIGAIASAVVYNSIEIQKIHVAQSLFMLCGSISIIAFAMPESYISNVIARIFFGLGFGSAYTSFIIYASEISAPKVRGQAIFLLHLFFTLGMFLFSVFPLIGDGDNSTNTILSGSFSTGLTLLSFMLGYFTLKSSHIFLMQNSSKDALERFQFFQPDSTDSSHVESEAMQSYIIDEKKRRFDFFGPHNVSALLVIFLVQLGYLSVTNALSHLLRTAYLSVYLTTGFPYRDFSQLVMIGTRMLGYTTGFFLLDRISKRIQYFIPVLITSILLFGFTTLVVIEQISVDIWIPLLFFLPIEFAIGIGLGPIRDILMGEIFPLKEKPVSVAVMLAFGEVIHIVILAMIYTWALHLGSTPTSFSFITGAVALICGIAAFFLIRDSRKQPLRLVANLYAKYK